MAKLKDDENPRSIKYYVKRYFVENKDRFAGKTFLDIPAGKGFTSGLLASIGAKVLPYDLFPEKFQAANIKCKHADLTQPLPLKDNSVDFVICQEGIEHLSDQLKVFNEFNRVLKTGGSLFLTTPNYSNLRSKMSYFLTESERFRTMMPPNEIDSVWGVSPDKDRVYLGHIFLMGIQKIRILGRLSGMNIQKIIPNRSKKTSLFLFLFTYPFILLVNFKIYLENISKKSQYPKSELKKIYHEIFSLNISPAILLHGHLFVELKKEKSLKEVAEFIESRLD